MTTPTFQIPFERRQGTDMTTKNLLEHPEVKDIAGGTQSYVLYAPKVESPGNSPIIIEVQHSVNFAFVNRSISLLLVDQETCLLESQGWKDFMVVRLFNILQQILSKQFAMPTSKFIKKYRIPAVKRQFQEEEDQDTIAAKSDTNRESSIRSFNEQKHQRTMEFTEQLKKKLEKG
ncbi:hypothetical protein F4703DRAFT_1916471 [Phycomyces blakesleeanus]